MSFQTEISNRLAKDFAINSSEWDPWFSFFAKKYREAFILQFDYFNKVLESIKKENSKPKAVTIHKKLLLILNYFSLFKDLELDENNEIKVSDKNMKRYREANKQEIILKEEALKELKNQHIEKDKVEMLEETNKLFNFVIAFYKEPNFRKDFFLTFIIDRDQNNIMFPLYQKKSNNFYNSSFNN